MNCPLIAVQRQLVEGVAICGARVIWSDERVGEMAMEQDMSVQEVAALAQRHPNQFESITEAYFDSLED